MADTHKQGKEAVRLGVLAATGAHRQEEAVEEIARAREVVWIDQVAKILEGHPMLEE